MKKQFRKEGRRGKNLRMRLDRIKRYVFLQAGEGCSALKVLPQLSRNSVRSLDEEIGVSEEDLLYVLKIDGWCKSVVRELAEARIKVVILLRQVYARAQEQHLIEEFRESGLAQSYGKIWVADSASIEEAIAAWHASQTVFSREKKTAVIKSAPAVSDSSDDPVAEKQEQTPEQVEEPKVAMPDLLTAILADYKELRKKEIYVMKNE